MHALPFHNLKCEFIFHDFLDSERRSGNPRKSLVMTKIIVSSTRLLLLCSIPHCPYALFSLSHRGKTTCFSNDYGAEENLFSHVGTLVGPRSFHFIDKHVFLKCRHVLHQMSYIIIEKVILKFRHLEFGVFHFMVRFA